MKRENKKVRKGHLTEITGNRLELEPYLGQTLECEVFVTNSLGYCDNKRLITEIRIPGTNYFVRHLWVKTWNLPLNKITHGYRTLPLKVIDYWDSVDESVKYGVKYAGEKLRKPAEAKMVIPKWKQQDYENSQMLKESHASKKLEEEKLKLKKPFGKIRKIKKVK